MRGLVMPLDNVRPAARAVVAAAPSSSPPCLHGDIDASAVFLPVESIWSSGAVRAREPRKRSSESISDSAVRSQAGGGGHPRSATLVRKVYSVHPHSDRR